MITCPVCQTEYDPLTSECPTCGPIPVKPGMSPGVTVPNYSFPGVTERVKAEVGYIVKFDQRGKVK